MIDLHTHILPGMDDGSKSVEESLEMLESIAEQGISHVAATPHFYAGENGPEDFLRRRAAAAAALRERWHAGLPGLLLGAEVSFFEGISRTEGLGSLCVEGTELLLLELPFSIWPDRLVSEVLELCRRPGIRIVLAHVERYMDLQPPESWGRLLDAGALTQCNAGFFLHWRTRRKALRMLRQGRIHFVASDCHNLSARPPRLGAALEVTGGLRACLEENVREFLPALEV